MYKGLEMSAIVRVNCRPSTNDSLKVVMITFGDSIMLERTTGALPTRAWVLTSEESVKVKPPSTTNLSLDKEVMESTPI